MTTKQMWKTIDDIESGEDIKLHLMMIRDRYEEVGESIKTEELTELINSSVISPKFLIVRKGILFEEIKTHVRNNFDGCHELIKVHIGSRHFVKGFSGTLKGKVKRRVYFTGIAGLKSCDVFIFTSFLSDLIDCE